MATVTPPPSNAPVPPSGGPSLASAVILNPPPALSSLQSGQTLSATLTAQVATGQVQVDTALGQLTLQTGLNIPRGAVLSLVLTAQHPRPTVQITAINGQPVGNAQAGQAATAQGTAPVAQPLTAGQTVTATLLRPALGVATARTDGPPSATQGTLTTPPTAGAAAPTAVGQPQAPGQTAGHAPGTTPGQVSAQSGHTGQGTPGAPQPTSAQGLSPPPTTTSGPGAPNQSAQGQSNQGQAAQIQSNQGQAARGQAAQAQTTQAQTPQGPAPQGQSTEGRPAPSTLPVGTRFTATVQRVDAPGAALATQSAAAAKVLAQGQVLNGAVSGRTQTGQPIIQTPSAPFAMGAPGSLTEGAKVSFRLDSLPLPPVAQEGTLEGPHGATRELVGARTWQDLTEALRTLAHTDPARLVQVAQNALPQPGAKLTNQMLFFLSALKGGNLRSLFGEASMRILETDRPELTKRLSTDFQTMARLVDEPQQGDWRLALIPLWTGEKLDQLRLFWRSGGGPEGEENEGEETRFVLDLDLSRLGHMQIDGLVKAKRNHLDLILRADQPLPDDMRAEITEIFESARGIAGLGGQVSFQTQPANFVPLPDPEPATGTSPSGPGLLA